MDLKDKALRLALTGWRVFPCGPDKTPLTSHGFKDATDAVNQVEAWAREWASDGALIGLALPDDWLVVDIDPRVGGDATVRAL